MEKLPQGMPNAKVVEVAWLQRKASWKWVHGVYHVQHYVSLFGLIQQVDQLGNCRDCRNAWVKCAFPAKISRNVQLPMAGWPNCSASASSWRLVSSMSSADEFLLLRLVAEFLYLIFFFAIHLYRWQAWIQAELTNWVANAGLGMSCPPWGVVCQD